MRLEPRSIFARQYRVIAPLAQGGMGAVYLVEQLSTDKRRALKLIERACTGGDGTGCNELGLMTWQGSAGPADPIAARALFLRACDLECALGCFNLGDMYDRGAGECVDPRRDVNHCGGCDRVCAVLPGAAAPVLRARTRSARNDRPRRGVSSGRTAPMYTTRNRPWSCTIAALIPLALALQSPSPSRRRTPAPFCAPSPPRG